MTTRSPSWRWLYGAGICLCLMVLPLKAVRLLDGGIDPYNLGKGTWIYVMSQATAQLGGNVPSVNNTATLMSYMKSQGIDYVVIKAGTGADDYPSSGSPQFTAAVVNAAHNAGLKIMGYTRSDGIDVPGEIALATKVFNLGADGFIIDAESEWESNVLSDNANKALQLAGGIKTNFPNKFLAHAPYPIISYHSSFPYREFGYWCDVVMPQDYWNEIGGTYLHNPAAMVQKMTTEYRTWQNGLSGKWTNAIKPIVAAGQGWNDGYTTTSQEIVDFVSALRNDANPASAYGYNGVNYWRAELHTTAIWTGIRTASIGKAPRLLAQARSRTVTNTSPVSVTLAVDSMGFMPLYYQWRFNGVNIAGATGTNYTVNPVHFTNSGNYSVVITNQEGSITSTNAVLTVRSAPVVTVPPVSQVAVAGANVSLNVSAIGTTPFTYQWRFNGTNLSGAQASSLARSPVVMTNAGDYSVVVGNAFGSITSSLATLTVVPSNIPPVITLQPLAQSVVAGNNVSLSVSNTGTPPLTYQWRLNGNALSGGTGSVLTLTNVTAALGGNYSVVVSNAAGTDTSANAALAVRYLLNLTLNGEGNVTKNPDQPDYAPGAVVTLTPGGWFSSWSGHATGSANPLTVTLNGNSNVTANFSTPEIILDNDDASPAVTLSGAWSPSTGAGKYGADYFYVTTTTGGTPTRSVIYRPTLPYAGKYQVEAHWVSGGNRSQDAPYRIAVGTATNTVRVDQETTANGWHTLTSSQTFPAGTTTSVRLDNDTSDSAQVVIADAVSFTYLAGAAITRQPASQTNLVGGSATFSVQAERATGYQWRFGNTAIAGATTDTLLRSNVQSTNAGNYTVVVSGTYGSVTSAVAVLVVNTLPTLTTAPVGQTVNPGGSVTFTAAASGTATLTYQWQFNGANLTNATGTSFTKGSLQAADAGSYAVVVRNAYGAAVSSNATLVVRTPPTVTGQPQDKTVNAGGSATFSVTVTGDAPLSYQWQHDGTNVAGTASSFSLSNIQPNQAGFYRVIVTNLAGTAISDVAELVVNTAPLIMIQPVGMTVTGGEEADFAVTASGTEPLFYQWRRQGTNLPGATASVYTKAEALLADAGNYSVVISNFVGTATSSNALLTVNPRLTELMFPAVQANGSVQLLLDGEPGTTNVVQVSTNLTTWQDLTNLLFTNRTISFGDASSNGLRFYRTKRGP